ncbi:MAG TPA: hypothetical protein GXZ23_03265 [Clostridiales bacterium]|jgi:hypothetical protein|nr:hypothetical protein [Clostridiales bacterium]
MKWKNFWDDLNIRKAIALLVTIAVIGLVTWLRSENLVSALLTIMSSIIGYYFGYENGQKIK